MNTDNSLAVLGIVRRTMARGPQVITALHVPETHFGAAMPVKKAFSDAGLDVQQINQAYESPKLAESLARHRDPAEGLGRIFGDDGMRIAFLTGWGSDPQSADELLARLYWHASRRPNLRVVAMNNASPVPHMIRSPGPTAHPDGEDFACHVARIARIERSLVDLHPLERTDPD